MKFYIKEFAVFAAASAFLCLSSTIALSQNLETTVDTSKVYELQEVIISASRYEQAPSTVGRNVTVITREEIENSIYTGLGDLLAEQQSFHVIGNNQTPGSLSQGFLRNSNSNHYIVMIDGVRISDPSTVNNGLDLSELSLLGVERIEIVRGSHSTLYGSSAIGGVVNIITRDRASDGVNANISTQHGTFGNETYSTSNNVQANITLENGFYTDLGVHQHFSNGLDASIDTVSSKEAFNPQDRDDFRKLDFNGKVGYKTSDADVYLSYRNEDQTSDVDQGAFNDDSNAKTEFQRDLLGYGAAVDLSESMELRLEGAYSDINRDFINDSSLVDRQGNYDGTFVETNGEGTLWENDLTASMGTDHAKFLAGLEASVQTMNFRNYIFSRSQFGIFEQTTDLDSLDLKEQIYSAFAHADINGGILSSKLQNFSLVLGARLSDHNEFGSHLTYEINPKYQISNSTLVYGAVSTGFNAPSLFQLNSPQQGSGESFSLGNSNLEPEESISYELGWKQELNNTASFEISLFRTEVENVIEYVFLWDGNTAIENLGFPDNQGDTYINISKQEINGLEVGLKLQPSSKFTIGGNLTLTSSTLGFSPDDINTAYTNGNHVQVFESGEFVNNEKELDGLTRRPNASALVRVQFRPLKALTLKTTSRFVGSRDDIFYSADLGPFGAQDRSKVEGYNLTDFSMKYRFNNNFSVMGKIENILDTDYVEINGFNTRGRSFFIRAQFGFGSM